jgi:hypothetical protein
VITVRRGPLIAAIWLIGLGLVFLYRQAAGLGWAEAWPLFVILGGVAGIVSRAVRGVRSVTDVWALTWPVLLIVLGVVLLAGTTGRLGGDPYALIGEWWPAALVVLGAWFLLGAVLPIGGGPQERLVIPLDGLGAAAVRIRFGAGELTTGRAAQGHLVDGTFGGGVVQRTLGPGRLELSQDTTFGVPWLDERSDWAVGLSAEVPLDLRLETGAAKAMIDLSDLTVRTVDLRTGASETTIRLPRAAGATTVRAETGAASLVIEVPATVAVRYRSRVALGSSHVDEARFPRSADGYASADFATAANRADIDVRGGVGSVRVVGVA